MIQRATGPQCLSSRVSALADGSLPDDVRDRALAHVTSCPDCRADLEAELLLRARLRALPAPRPSSSLLSALLAMGEPGGPVPPRAGHVPGMPRPAPVRIREHATDAPWQRATSRRPVGAGRPGGHGSSRRRTVVGATAGAVGAGVIAAALVSGLPAASQVPTASAPQRGSAVDVSARLADPPSVRGAEPSTDGGRGPGGRAGGIGGITGVEAVFSTAGRSPAWPSGGPAAQPVVAGVTTTLLHHVLAQSTDPTVGLLSRRSLFTRLPATTGLGR